MFKKTFPKEDLPMIIYYLTGAFIGTIAPVKPWYRIVELFLLLLGIIWTKNLIIYYVTSDQNPE